VPVAVDLDQPLPCLLVIGACQLRAPRDAQDGRQVHQRGVQENVGSAGFPAEIVGAPGQVLGAGEIPDRAPVVDQVGGGPERVHVVHAQVVSAPLEHVLTFL
jgi:hypothetical protein